MKPTLDDPLQSSQDTASDSSTLTTEKATRQQLPSVNPFPYRRSNPSYSTLFASTTALASLSNLGQPSGPVTPPLGIVNGSIFSPGGPVSAKSPPATPPGQHRPGEIRDLIHRAFSPHVSVLASQDAEELVRHKGIDGGLLELLRPFGENVAGKVTIRDSAGISRSWEDFGIRFVGVHDGLELPRLYGRNSTDSASASTGHTTKPPSVEHKPARLRTGGDIPQIEELVERHLTFAEEHSGPVTADYLTFQSAQHLDPLSLSPFYSLYIRRLLSGVPLTPSETISHPVAAVIAISSRSTSPIEDLRTLYDSSNTGEHRLPQWVHNEFLRYYVLIHDEDYDDITKSMALYDQMKRHFGLHCHLLRLRSSYCVPSDDDSVALPSCEWISAGEELAEIVRREASEDDDGLTPYVFESDASALRAFVREMVTQSVIPSMERASATWNDQVASRRRGISGRFMSLSKRFTTFGNRNSTGSLGSGNSNYDAIGGFYRPDAPEAIMRKLADYSMMLRDYRLAQSTFEILCSDFKSDKAWKYYAGANEMAAVSSLLVIGALSSKVRIETIDQYIETAYYSYATRVGAPYNALRTLLLGMELLKLRGGSALDDAARWIGKIIDDKLVGPVGHALLLERTASCYTDRKGVGQLQSGDRHRKAAFWNTLATDAWLRLDKSSQAEKRRLEAIRQYGFGEKTLEFQGMASFLLTLQEAVAATRSGPQHIDGEELLLEDQQTMVEPLQSEDNRQPHSPGMHRKSLSVALLAPTVVNLDPLGSGSSEFRETDVVPLSPQRMPLSPVKDRANDGFE